MIHANLQTESRYFVKARNQTRPPLDEKPEQQRPRDREKMLGSLLSRSGLCLAVLNSDLRVLEASPELLQLFSRAPKDLVNHSMTRLLHPISRQQVAPKFASLIDYAHGHFVAPGLILQAASSTFLGQLIAVSGEAHDNTVHVVVVVFPEKRTVPHSAGPPKNIDAKILEGVAAGKPTTQLANELYLSRQGVEYHVSTMMRKFSVPNRAALVSKAFSMGLFSMANWPPRILTTDLDYPSGGS